VVIAFFMIGLVYLIEISLGWITFYAYAWELDSPLTVITMSLIAFLTFILVGWNEELLSRGYHLQNITSGLNLVWGVIFSSLIFGVLHLVNNNATWAGAVGTTLAGLLFAFSYLRTKQLWLPIGIHVGWNFFEGVLFGFPVSGIETYRLFRISVNGPKLSTGGYFGPEAGLVLLPALLLGLLLIYTYTRNRYKQRAAAVELEHGSHDPGYSQ